MGYNANGYGYLTIEKRLMPELLAEWSTLLNKPVAPDRCGCRYPYYRGKPTVPCNGPHKTLYENDYAYNGGQTQEQYSAYSFEDIAELFGYEIDDSWDKNEGEVLNYRLEYEDQSWSKEDLNAFLELLQNFCKEGDTLNFEGDDEEHWMYLYKDGTFTLHSAVVQILYPTAYEKDATIMKDIFRGEREEETN